MSKVIFQCCVSLEIFGPITPYYSLNCEIHFQPCCNLFKKKGVAKIEFISEKIHNQLNTAVVREEKEEKLIIQKSTKRWNFFLEVLYIFFCSHMWFHEFFFVTDVKNWKVLNLKKKHRKITYSTNFVLYGDFGNWFCFNVYQGMCDQVWTRSGPRNKEKKIFFFLVCMFRCKHCEKKYGEKSLLELIDCTCWLFERNNY